MSHADAVWRDLSRVRELTPLVHNITNYVVTNTTANALLALGASPAMTHDPGEMRDMVAIANAVVVNMGTLTPTYVSAIPLALSAAAAKGVPVVLDPVAAGALPSRTDLALSWLAMFPVAVIRANAGEIMALAGVQAKARGVDSLEASDAALEAALSLAETFACVVCVSGAVDLVTDGDTVWRVRNGHPMMTRVTGMGCTASAITGAFAAVARGPGEGDAAGTMLGFAASAAAVMALAGEIAAERAKGPGTLQLEFFDALYLLKREEVAGRLRMEQA